MKKSDAKFTITNKALLYIIPFLGFMGVITPLIIGQTNLALLGSYLAIPMIFAPIIYILQNKNECSNVVNRRGFLLLSALYITCLFISLILLHIYEIRSFIYYIVIVFMFLLILLQILLFHATKNKITIILFEIMFLTLNIVWGVTLKYNYYFGLTDVFAHSWFIQNLISYGYVTDAFGIYRQFPLWHILCTSSYIITGLSIPIHKIMFIVNGITFSFIILFTYIIAIKLFTDKKIALLSSLIASIYPYLIIYGMYSIPRGVVIFFEIMLIALLLDVNDQRKKILAILITFSIIGYHTVSIIFILFIFIAYRIISVIYVNDGKSKFMGNTYLAIVLTSTLVYWMYNAEILFKSLINYIVIPAPEEFSMNSILSFTPLEELFNYMQYSFILFFLILGALWAIKSNKYTDVGKKFCILGLLFATISFPGPALLFEKLSVNFNIIRFGQYTVIFIIITVAIGFYKLYCKSNKHIKFIVIMLLVIMSFLSISNDFTASDNPLVKRPFFTFYLTEEEIIATNHIVIITKGYLMVDDVISRYLFSSPHENKEHILEIDKENMSFLTNSSSDLILIRNNELTKRPLHLYSSKSGVFEMSASRLNLEYYYDNLILWNDLNAHNKIYQSGSLTAFN